MTNNKQHPVVFFGAGPIASRSLESLIENFTIEAVITKPETGRNKAPVIELAKSRGLTVLTPTNRLELSEIFENNKFKSQVGVVIDFGIIIAPDVFNSFPMGIVNSHFSLLPEWRGADPITFAILSGQTKTGVSLMRIVEALDEGPIIHQAELTIPDHFTTPDLTDSLIKLSNQLIISHLPEYLDNKIELIDQSSLVSDKIQPSYSRKLTKDDGIIDWQKPAKVIEREIRAFIGWPQSRCQLGDLDLIITEARVVDQQIEPGQHQKDKKSLVIGCGNSKSLSISRLKPAGKKEMSIDQFLAGYGSRL